MGARSNFKVAERYQIVSTFKSLMMIRGLDGCRDTSWTRHLPHSHSGVYHVDTCHGPVQFGLDTSRSSVTLTCRFENVQAAKWGDLLYSRWWKTALSSSGEWNDLATTMDDAVEMIDAFCETLELLETRPRAEN